MKIQSILLTATTVISLTVAAARLSDPMEKVGEARLNLARELISAYDNNLACEALAYPSDINDQVSAALALLGQEALDNFVASLPADSKMRADLAFRHAAGLVNIFDHQLTSAVLEKGLIETRFFNLGQGVYGSTTEVYLRANGVAEVRILKIDDDGTASWEETTNAWSAKVQTVGGSTLRTVTISGVDYELGPSIDSISEIWLQPMDRTPGQIDTGRTLSSSPSLCDAAL